MADRNIQDLFREKPELLEELRNYFNPKPEIVKVLPNVKTVEDFKTVFLADVDDQGQTFYTEYRMLNGGWYEAS